MAEEATKIVEQYDLAPETPSGTLPEAPEKTGEPPATPPRDAAGRFAKAEQHPKVLLKMALEAGVDQDTINETPSADLREYVRDLKMASALQAQANSFNARQDTFNQQTAKTENAPSGNAATSGSSIFPDEDRWDENLVKLLKDQQRQIKDMQETIQELRGHAAAQIRETEAQQIDRVFESLDEGFAPLLGRGGRPDDGSSELILRRAILADAIKLAGDKPKLKDVLGKIKEAATAKFGKLVGKQPEKKTTPSGNPPVSTNDWDQAALSRPTFVTGAAEPPSPQKAIQSVEAYMRENATAEPSSNILNDFLN